jgi:hypothetical protein
MACVSITYSVIVPAMLVAVMSTMLFSALNSILVDLNHEYRECVVLMKI